MVFDLLFDLCLVLWCKLLCFIWWDRDLCSSWCFFFLYSFAWFYASENHHRALSSMGYEVRSLLCGLNPLMVSSPFNAWKQHTHHHHLSFPCFLISLSSLSSFLSSWIFSLLASKEQPCLWWCVAEAAAHNPTRAQTKLCFMLWWFSFISHSLITFIFPFPFFFS
jgi:hypothetical protein